MIPLKQQAQNLAQSSFMHLASVVAFVAAFVLTPMIDRATAGWVVENAIAAYGHDMAWLARWGWFAAVGAGVFFLARAFIALALMFIAARGVMALI